MEKGGVRGSTVVNTGYEKYLYSVKLEESGERLDDLENMIATIEGKASPILEKLILGVNLTDQERAEFASFMAIMYVRTDSFRYLYAEMSMNIIQRRKSAFHRGLAS